MTGVTFAPLLPVALIMAISLVAGVASLVRLRRAVGGTLLRLLAIGLAAVALLGPQLRQTQGETLPDIAVIIEDESRSVSLGGRAAILSAAAAELEASLDAKGLEVRRIAFGDRQRSDLATALEEGLADLPYPRLSAVFALTDGQVHGAIDAAAGRLGVPLHGLLAGDPATQIDRRVEIVRAPRFGLVGESVDVALRVVSPTETGAIAATLYVGGEPQARQDLEIGQEVTLKVRLPQPGETIIELGVDPIPGELTPLNNRAVISLTAVRDRLRVLLVSGEPHAGERVWRNILKSDPAVDLVHFTILKPSGKITVARRDELNLIEFPHQELFLEKLDSFDVVIFDRYTYRYVLDSFEFEEIARFVERGGAILIASGPEFATGGSLAGRPNLAYILPVMPTGPAIEQAYTPTLTGSGERHPITNDLERPADWGRWLRYLPGRVRQGEVLMAAANGAPLLVVDRVKQGRIAVMMSDHVWLWARGFDGGGPHRELLRRLVHWLMQEPELEEEALMGDFPQEGTLALTRRTLADDAADVIVTDPEGEERTVSLTPAQPGQFTATVPAPIPGLYRLRTSTADGETLYALAATGEDPARELDEVLTTEALIAPAATASGGGVFTLATAGANLPQLRTVRAGQAAAGPNWAGLVPRRAQAIESVRLSALLPAWLWASLIGGAIFAAWWLESGRRS